MRKLRQENVPEVTKLVGGLNSGTLKPEDRFNPYPLGVSVVPMSLGWSTGVHQGSSPEMGGLETIVLCWLNSQSDVNGLVSVIRSGKALETGGSFV